MGYKKFRETRQFDGPIQVGKQGAVGHDVRIWSACAGYGLKWDANQADLEFHSPDMLIKASAASTLAIRNNRASGSILLGSTGSYVTFSQDGAMRLQDLKRVEFGAADIYATQSAASTLSIVNARTSGSIRLGSSGSYVTFGQDGAMRLLDLKAAEFGAADLAILQSAASTLAIRNNRASGSILLGSTGSYATFGQDGGVRLWELKGLDFGTPDIAILQSAASTLAIRNNRASGSILLGSTGSYATFGQDGGVRLWELKGLDFGTPDISILQSAASTLYLRNNRASGSILLGSTGSYTSFGQDGNIRLQDLKGFEFGGTDIKAVQSAASTLALRNDRASGSILLGSTGSYVSFAQDGAMRLQDLKRLEFGAADIYASQSAASTLSIVNARATGQIQLGGTANYTQFSQAGVQSLVGGAIVKNERWVSPLAFYGFGAAASANQSNSKWPSLRFLEANLGASANKAVYALVPAPMDAATACDSEVYIDLATRLANTLNGSRGWTVGWDIIPSGSATGITGSGTITASYNEGQYAIQEFCACSRDHISAANRWWGFNVTMTGSGVPGSCNVDFLGLRWRYHSDKLGQ